MPSRKRKVVRQREETSPLQRRIHIAWKNLVLFIIILIISVVLLELSSDGTIFNSLFFMLSLISGFVALALLIVLIVFVILKRTRGK